MNTRIILYTLVILISACGGGGGSPPQANTPPPVIPPVTGPTAAETLAAELAGKTLTEFYDLSFKALYSRSPETVVWQALTDIFPLESVGLNDLSDAYQRETYAMYQVVLDQLHTYDRASLSAEQKIDHEVYRWHLQDNIDQLPFLYYDFRATYSLFGTQRGTETFFTDIHPLSTVQDAEDYITRLLAVSTKFSQLANHLLLQRDNGIVEPALSMQVAINQVRPVAQNGVDNNPYYTSFVTKVSAIPGLSASDRSALIDRARTATENSVIPAYATLLSTLEGLQSRASGSIGVRQFTGGDDYYAYILKHHTTSSLTATEIHQLGLRELQRIHAQMRLLFDQLGYPQNERISQSFARVEHEAGTVPAAEVLPTYEALIYEAESRLDQAFAIFPEADVVVKPDDFGGFYIGPSFDGTRPGAFYAGTTTAQPRYQMASLTYHESVPGHHTQIALAMEQDVPAFRKLIRFTAFVEGWALYAERLAAELGWYDDDVFGDLGRLQYEALRAARLIMDTGIHHLGWSFEQATQFNQDNVGWSRGASENAAARYSVSPGQATAYMIGMLKILEVRQRAMDELGDRFDLKDFHTAVLSSGAVPLDVLDDVIDQYIAATLAQSR